MAQQLTRDLHEFLNDVSQVARADNFKCDKASFKVQKSTPSTESLPQNTFGLDQKRNILQSKATQEL